MKLPEEIKSTIENLKKAGFEAYAVGGCVRDFLLGQQPGDWDITTSASPEEIQKIFQKNFYENAFGTVTILTGNSDKTLAEIEITPFRKEGKYTDKRHPDTVVWAKTLEEDLSRRDFTVNALALRPASPKLQRGEQSSHLRQGFGGQAGQASEIIDLFGGQEDLKNKLIRTVGEPTERFNEDALRLMRAPRLARQLDFQIEEKTQKAIQQSAEWLRAISHERIRDELIKILMFSQASDGILLLRKLNLLKYIMPELEEGWGVEQNKHHEYTVFDHSIKSLAYTAEQGYSLEVRLAALLHDIAKPRTKLGEGPDCHFYGHDILSAKMAAQILERLRFPHRAIEKVMRLIRAHMFIYNTNPVLGAVTTDAAVRRIIRRVGEENIWDLARLRLADRAGSGVKKIEKFDNRHFKFRVEKLLREPLSVKMLAINGSDLMEILKISPGPKVGWLLNALLQEVLDDPEKNKREVLIRRMETLNQLSDSQLKELADESKKEVGLYEEQVDEKIKEKYWVK